MKNKNKIPSRLKDSIICITGGTGSFGNEVMNFFLDSNAKEIRIVSRDEKKQDLYNTVSVPYKSYPVLGVHHKTVDFRSYSVQGFLTDIKHVIYNAEVEPEKINKVEKRIIRHVIFLVMYVLGPYVEGCYWTKLNALKVLSRWTLDTALDTGIEIIDDFSKLQLGRTKAHRSKIRKHLTVFCTAFEKVRNNGSPTPLLHLSSLKNMERFFLL